MGGGGLDPDGSEWSASRPGSFTPKERTLRIHSIGRSVGSGAGLDALAKRKDPWFCWEENPGRPARNPSHIKSV